MNEDEIYKVCRLRCAACEYVYEGEVECMGEMIPRKTKVIDRCPHCQQINDNLYLGEV